MHGPLRSSDLIRIFHSHFGKSREKPYEKRGANTFECVVEKTRHAGLETCEPKLGLPTAGWEACDTTLECRCVSRRIVARFQRLMATVAANPGRCPGLSCCGLSGLLFAAPCWKKKAMDLALPERLRGCDTAGWEACAPPRAHLSLRTHCPFTLGLLFAAHLEKKAMVYCGTAQLEHKGLP